MGGAGLAEVGYARKREAAANVMLNTISKLRDRTAAKEAEGTPPSGELRGGAGIFPDSLRPAHNAASAEV
jgi:hypothetical protein